MKKILDFGKVDYNGSGHKNCRVTVEIELKDGALSICGNVWNPRETDIYCGGQCLDTLAELLPHNKKLARIVEIWKAFHLNDLKAGTAEQEAIIADYYRLNGATHNYTTACEVLKNAGKYIVDASGYQTAAKVPASKEYAYGAQWLFWPLPAEIIAEVESL